MKKVLCLLLAFTLSLGLLINSPVEASASTTTVSVTMKYGQSEARGMLADINAFRTSKTDAWAYDSSGKKVTYSGLQELTYDYELERIAMLRAAEIALYFSHTRPNGESCFSVYDSITGAVGENIAAWQTSADKAFCAWKEDSQDYSGQGHRRNMLSSSYTAIGIGHVEYQGKHYWVQEFRSSVSAENDPGANDSKTTVTIEVDPSIVTVESEDAAPTDKELKASVKLKTSSKTLKKGKTCKISFTDALATDYVKKITYTSSDKKIATVTKNGKVTAKKKGTATIKCKVTFESGASKTVKFTVKVKG